LRNDDLAIASNSPPPDFRPIVVPPHWIYDYYITIDLEMELGENTREILAELGYSSDKINKLEKDGVIKVI